ncbi:hypothetical protein D3C73_1345700 [compost metagenome]
MCPACGYLLLRLFHVEQLCIDPLVHVREVILEEEQVGHRCAGNRRIHQHAFNPLTLDAKLRQAGFLHPQLADSGRQDPFGLCLLIGFQVDDLLKRVAELHCDQPPENSAMSRSCASSKFTFSCVFCLVY